MIFYRYNFFELLFYKNKLHDKQKVYHATNCFFEMKNKR